MSNLINFPGTRITTASRKENPARQPLQSDAFKVERNYAAMPAWVTSCLPLNRAVMKLQAAGWTVEVIAPGLLECSHPAIETAAGKVTFEQAQYIQRQIEELRA